MHVLESPKKAFGVFFSIALASFAFFGIGADAGQAKTLLERAKGVFAPLPKDMATEQYPITPERVSLGKSLFFDPRLSLDGTVACQNCHWPQLYGTDALKKSIGVEQRVNSRNAPTVLNAALQFKAHWIGDRADIEEQAQKSLTGKASMGNPDTDTVVRKLKALGYEQAFKRAFPEDSDPITPRNWGVAIGAYERTLTTPSPFDRYLEGEERALSSKSKDGLLAFMNEGCITCHNGVGVGGGSFQKFGLFGDYWLETGSAEIDQGRFEATKSPADKYVFKVPSLRNVAMTPPYFHDGSVEKLSDAVGMMSRLQLGKSLDEGTTAKILAFLESLTGDMPKNFLLAPVLSPSPFTETLKEKSGRLK